MGVVTRVVHACLRLAVRRWPAELRDELSRDWLAELAVLEQQPGTTWQRLWFAVSLATGPRADDEGLPHARGQWWRAPGPVAGASLVLLLVAGFGLGLSAAVESPIRSRLFEFDGSSDLAWWRWADLLADLVAAVVTAVYGVVVCRRLGRWYASRSSRSLTAAHAALAVASLGVVLLGWQRSIAEIDAILVSGMILVAVWALATFVLVVVTTRLVAAGRSRRGWVSALFGVPLAAGLAATAAVPPRMPGGDIPEGDIGASAPWQVMVLAIWVLPWTASAISFGWAAARPHGAGPVAVDAPVPHMPPVVRGQTHARPTAPQLIVTVAAAGAAVLWAIGLVLWQPLSEPTDVVGENSTYWARELRWYAIAAMVLAVVVCARGQRRATGYALLGGLAWLVADIGLDRAELPLGTAPVAIAAAAVAVGSCYQGTAAKGEPSRTRLLVVASIAAVLAGLSLLTTSPTGIEPALDPASSAVSCLLAVIAIGAALGATHRPSPTRSTLGYVAVAIAATAPWALRGPHPNPTLETVSLLFGFSALLILIVAMVAWRRPATARQSLRFPAVAVCALLAVPLVLMPAVITFMIVGVCGVFTALAGNPPINSADSDVILVFPGIATGLVIGALVVFAEPKQGDAETRKAERKTEPSQTQ